MSLVHEELTEGIIGAAVRVHRELGPGLLESAYATCMAFELTNRGLVFEREVDLPVNYCGRALETGYRIDFVVDDKVILELKAIEKVLPIHEAQLMTYLRLSGKPVGLLINFNVTKLTDGLMRRVC